jgi:uncharacterized membrane protein YcaP (DUF421 family)
MSFNETSLLNRYTDWSNETQIRVQRIIAICEVVCAFVFGAVTVAGAIVATTQWFNMIVLTATVLCLLYHAQHRLDYADNFETLVENDPEY